MYNKYILLNEEEFWTDRFRLGLWHWILFLDLIITFFIIIPEKNLLHFARGYIKVTYP